jgi:excisionase family DNA binding protein
MVGYLTVKEASQFLGIKPSTLYVWAERGEIPSYKFGRLRRFKMSHLETWAESRSEPQRDERVPSSFCVSYPSGDIRSLIEKAKQSVLKSSEGKARHASRKGG